MGQSLTKEELFIDLAATYIKCPYVWGGRGNVIFVKGGVVPNTFFDKFVFDCSGLITYTLWKLGEMGIITNLPDMRGTHNTDIMFAQFPKTDAREVGTLLFWGRNKNDPNDTDHVAIDMGRGFILDASGGGSTTLTPQDARLKNAMVRMHYNRRDPKTFLGARRIPLDRSELKVI